MQRVSNPNLVTRLLFEFADRTEKVFPGKDEIT